LTGRKSLNNLTVPLYNTGSEPGLIPFYEIDGDLTGFSKENHQNKREPSIYYG
jgi:hypothetical protein